MGRLRKKGRREPNGRVARAYINPRAQVAAQPHRRQVKRQFREFPEAATEFGRLMLTGKISPAQHEAGARYAMLVGLYRLYYGIPSPNPRALDLVQASGGYDGASPEIPETLRRGYDDAFVACAAAGNRAQRAVNAHAVFDHRLMDSDSLILLKRGLDALVKHFGLDASLQISSRRK